ncbi:MAG: DUF4386 domain-containing protein [Pseudomonadota bacterium]|nr:DUF4386 domain-containing protein [Pseudomonadota bacterium]
MIDKMTQLSQRKAAVIAGLAYLIVFFLTPHAWIDKLIVPGDAAATFTNLSGSESLFRVGIVSWLIVLVADTVLAWALYYFLKPVNRGLSFLAGCFRLLFVAIFAVNMLSWAEILPLLEGSELLATLNKSQLEAQAMLHYAAYIYGSNIAFIFFGLHIGIVGYLVWKSGYIPRALGVLLLVAFAGYLIDSFASFLSPNYANNDTAFWIIVALPAILSEFSLTIWLLIKGGKTANAKNT